MKLIRVIYGDKNTPKADREYKQNGVGPVGSLSEWEKEFPGEEFEIIDHISGVD